MNPTLESFTLAARHIADVAPGLADVWRKSPFQRHHVVTTAFPLWQERHGTEIAEGLAVTLRSLIDQHPGHPMNPEPTTQPAPMKTIHDGTEPAPDITRPDTLETRRWCIVSTAHMTREDNARMKNGDQPPAYHGEHDNGFTFFTVSDEDEDPAEWQRSGFSDMLRRNLRALHEAGFQRAEFDRDAAQVAGLETADW